MEYKMTNTKWALLFGAAVFMDVFQIFLDVILIGLFINPPIDLGIGVALTYYMRKQGVKPTVGKMIAWIGVPFIEVFTAGGLPFWWLDVIFLFVLEKIGGAKPAEAESDKPVQNKKAA
jgi:hypothetical protein